MNLKKLKRLLCIALSAAMVLSTNMTGFAAETGQVKLVMEENEAPGKEAPKDSLDLNTGSSGSRSNAKAAISTAAAGDCQTHTVISVKRVAPTCFTEGILAHYTCSSCNKLYKTRADALAETNDVTADELKISKLNHAPVEVGAQDPTCTEEGNIAYYTCNLCGEKYATIEDFYNNTNNLSDSDVTQSALGHSYTQDGNTTCVFTGVEDLTPETYEEGESCGITASRTCSREGCTYKQQAVVSVRQDALSQGFDCTAPDSKLTYAVTATFTDDPENPSENQTPTTETTTGEFTVTGHKYIYAFDWDGLELVCDEEGVLDYKGAVTAKRTCEYCKQDDTAQGNSVTAQVALTQEGKEEPYTLKCIAEGSFEFTATADFGSNTETDKQSLQLPLGLHSDLKLVEGREATCENDGWYEHFECGVCNEPCWDEATLAPQDEIEIRALGHNIGLPTFEPTADGLAVEATFKCMRNDIVIKKTETCEIDKTDPTYSVQNATCGDTVDITYPVTVEFDRKSIQEDAQGSWSENTGAEGYAPITYTGTVKYSSVVLKHSFTSTAAWKGSADSEGHYDPTQGVTVTLTCSKCGGTIVLDSEGAAVSGSLASVSTDATVEIGAIDTGAQGYQEATCVANGTDVYPLTITGSTTDAAGTNFGDTVTLTNVSLKTGHKYLVKDVTEGTPDSNGSPTVESLKVSCGNCNLEEIEYDSSSTPSNITVTVNKVTTKDEYGYTPATCTRGGTDVWTLDVQITGDNNKNAYKEYKDGTAVPWTIAKETDKLQHNFASTVASWDWSAYGTVGDTPNDDTVVPFETEDGAQNPVYGLYQCSNPGCDGIADADSEPDQADGTSYITVDGTRMKKVAAEVTVDNSITDCTGSGNEITHTAKLGDETSVKKEAVSGHKWGDVTWGEWAKVEDASGEPEKETISVTVGDEQVSFEVYKYTITASRTCKVCSTTENFAEEEDTANNIKSGITVTRGTTDINTCNKSGSTLYWASVDLEGDGTNTKNLIPHIEVYKPLGHNYEIQWTWYGKTETDGAEAEVTSANEKDIIVYTRAEAEKVCTRCKKSIKSSTVEVQCDQEEEGIRCEETDVFFYTATATFTDAPEEEYTGQKWVIHPGNGHNYEWKIPEWPAEEAVEAGTYTVTINGSCKNNPSHTVTIQNATVILEEDGIDHEPATCSKGETLVATGTFSGTGTDGKQYEGTCTYEQPAGQPDPEAHSYQAAVIDWSKGYLTDGTVDKEAGTVTYQVTAVATCEYDNGHTLNIPVVAVAPLEEVEEINCIHTFTIHYSLSIEGDEFEGMSLADSSPKAVTHTAGTHGTIKREKGEEGTCEVAGYSPYYECQTCHVKYSNMLATDEYETKVETLAPLGHRYENPVYVWTKEGEEVSAIFTCTRSGCQENSKSGYNKTFLASIDKDSDGKPVMYVEKEAECVGTGVTGEAYYMVSLNLSNNQSINGSEFTKGLVYHGDVPVQLPAGDHEEDSANPGICKWCQKTIADMATVTWQANSKTVDTKVYNKGTVTEAEIAKDLEGISAPSRSGYDFLGWSVDGAEASSQLAKDILAKVQDGSSVTVTAIYEKKSGDVVVTVHYVNGAEDFKEITSKVHTGTVGSYVNLDIAKDAVTDSTLEFSYWANDARVKVSTSQAYSLYLTTKGTVDLYAVFASVSTEEDPTPNLPSVAMSSKYATITDDGKKKLSFVASMDIPEGYRGVQSGMIYCTDQTAGTEPALMVLGSTNSNVMSKAFTSTDYVTNILTVGVTNIPETQVYVRGYLICSDESGNQITVYSNIDHASYNDFVQAE